MVAKDGDKSRGTSTTDYRTEPTMRWAVSGMPVGRHLQVAGWVKNVL